ncbi:MAG: MFS transporter [Methanomicrobia archaeon]|nr:MFS transporter [Methanomicrobia archaeon]
MKEKKKNDSCDPMNSQKFFYIFIPFKLAQGCVSILIPLLIVEFGGKAKEVGIVLGLYTAVLMIGTVFWGKISDKFKKRKSCILIGFSGAFLLYFFLSMATTLFHVIVIQTFFAFFIAAEIPVTTVYILRSTTKFYWDEAISRFNKIIGWAWVTGLGIGAIALFFVSIQNLFLINSIISAISLILGFKYLKQKPIQINRRAFKLRLTQIVERARYMPNYLIHLPTIRMTGNKKINSFFISVFLLLMASSLVMTPIIPYLKMLGVGSSVCFLAGFMHSSAAALMYQRTGRAIYKNGTLKMLKYGIVSRGALSLLMVGLILYKEIAVGIILIYAVLGITWSYIIIPSFSYMSKTAEKDREGGAFGAFNFFYSFGLLAGNFLSGIIVDLFGYEVDIFLAVILLLIVILNLKNSKIEEKKIDLKKIYG